MQLQIIYFFWYILPSPISGPFYYEDHSVMHMVDTGHVYMCIYSTLKLLHTNLLCSKQE